MRWAKAVMKETGVNVPYQVGTMIELPRAALRAGEIAQSAEFFSFGTNDLTQTTLGISRDDAASFLGPYTAKGILPADPFVTLDQEGVGELVKIAAERGRKTRPDIKLGICGEHGGDPASIALLRERRARLRVLLALPRADRPPRGRAGRARQAGREHRVSAQPRMIYVAVMCAAGVLLASLSLAWPGALSGYATAFGVMLAASFVTDIVLMRFAGEGEIMPLSIEWRFGGFFAGMLLYLAITGMFGTAPA